MAENRVVRKLIDRADIINDLVYRITPQYFPQDTLDKARTSIYGWMTESFATAFEDTVVLEQRRAQDYCAELSNNEIHVNQTAKLREVDVERARPGRCFAMLGILKTDIIAKGTPYGNEIRFILDRRSTILYGGVNFSLEDDIIIRAVKRGTGYLYAANYTGEHSSYESYLQVFEATNTYGEEILTLVAQIYQCRYNISEKHVTDALEFQYDGLYFDYDNQLSSFELYYKKSPTDTFRKIDGAYYLTEAAHSGLYYNDDESGLLRILDNPVMNLGINSIIRVEIKETLGTEGNIDLTDDGNVTFQMYRDSAYSYAGIHVFITMLSDTVYGTDGDDLATLKRRLINEKTCRKNITTEHDIITYINDIDANIQLVKKRNDIQDRNYFMYTLVRYGDDKAIAPATTKPLALNGVRSVENLGDFDQCHPTVKRKIVRAYSKFRLNVVDGEPDEDYVTKVPIDEKEEGVFYLTCPYMILLNDLDIAYYYYTCVNEHVYLSMKAANNFFPYQMICRSVHMYRDSHDPKKHDIYTFTVKATLNTENDDLLVNKKGEIEHPDQVMCHIFFPLDGSPTAYLPMELDSYDEETREFTFIGEIRTTDYITEEDKLEICEGLKQLVSDTNYYSTIDFKDASFQVSFMFKEVDEEGIYGRDDTVYNMLPAKYTKEYVLMNNYYNDPNHLYNMILEFSKFSRSPVQLSRVSTTSYNYKIGAVPFFEYEFGTEWTAQLYDTFKNMATVYGSLLKMTTDFEVALKFIATYGASKYIYLTGGQHPSKENEYSEKTLGEETHAMRDLNPTIYFKVFGFGAPVEEIRDFIYRYLRDTYIADVSVYMSNICTYVEETYPAVKSIKYMGITTMERTYDGSYQEFIYKPPKFVNRDIITRFVPEQFNITDIRIELDEDIEPSKFEKENYI